MQSSSTTIGMAVSIWLELEDRVRGTAAATVVSTRSQQLVGIDFSAAAFALDPRFHGDVPPAIIQLARNYMSTQQVAAEFDEWLTGTGFFKDIKRDRRVHPSRFWKAQQLSGAHPVLCRIGTRLGASIASSADVERSFSALSSVYGKRRQALGVEKAQRLAFLYRRLRDVPEATDTEDDDES
jgi:hypothetical protein